MLIIILTILLIPITRLCIGSAIGTSAAIFPLTLAAILLIARVSEDALLNLPRTFIEIGQSMGATPLSIVRKILLPEALPSLVIQLTTIAINLVGFSAMAGTVGGGGLGDLAIRFGHQRYDVTLVVTCVVFTINCKLQMMGNALAHYLRR